MTIVLASKSYVQYFLRYKPFCSCGIQALILYPYFIFQKGQGIKRIRYDVMWFVHICTPCIWFSPDSVMLASTVGQWAEIYVYWANEFVSAASSVLSSMLCEPHLQLQPLLLQVPATSHTHTQLYCDESMLSTLTYNAYYDSSSISHQNHHVQYIYISL